MNISTAVAAVQQKVYNFNVYLFVQPINFLLFL